MLKIFMYCDILYEIFRISAPFVLIVISLYFYICYKENMFCDIKTFILWNKSQNVSLLFVSIHQCPFQARSTPRETVNVIENGAR